MTFAAWSRPEKPPPEFVVDVVRLPEPPQPKPPEPPPAPAPTPPMGLPPPPPPQLTEAPIAEKSAPPPHESPVKAPPRDKAGAAHDRGKALVARAETSLRATTKAPEAEPIAHEGQHDATPEGAGGRATEVASQTVQDFVLMQIARVWIIDLHSPRFRGLEITWGFTLRPDGTLAPPFGKDDPWDLERMVNAQTYAAMQLPTEQGQIFRTAVTTFLQALRQAQPFRVPSDEKSYKDRILPLRFRAGDLAQSPTEAGR